MFQPITRRSRATALRATALRARMAASIVAAMVSVTAAGMVAAPALAYGGDGLRAAANHYRSAGFHEGNVNVAGGLNPVTGSALLDDISSNRATQMINKGYLEHNLEYVGKRLKSSGVCWKTFGEIIAWERGYPTYSYDRVMLAWMRSEPHREIVMGQNYDAAGGAWRRADDGAHFSVMVFAQRCDASASNQTIARLRLEKRYDPDRQLVFLSGRHTGYRLSAKGEVLGRKTITYHSRETRRAAGRARANGKAWIKVSSGALDGYWVHEAPSQYVRGMTLYRVYASDRGVRVEADRYRAYKFDWLGRVKDSRARTFSRSTRTRVEARAIINGRAYLRFSSGWLAGHWVRDTSQIDFV
jgi:uncharacterized protein YkwD